MKKRRHGLSLLICTLFLAAVLSAGVYIVISKPWLLDVYRGRVDNKTALAFIKSQADTKNYLDSLQQNGSKAYLDSYANGALMEEGDAARAFIVQIGEQLPNGGRNKFGTFFVTYDQKYKKLSDTKDVLIPDDYKYLELAYKDNNNQTYNYIDQFTTCRDIKTEYHDVDKDGRNELFSICSTGGVLHQIDLSIFQVSDRGVYSLIGNPYVDGNYAVDDFNKDGYLDVKAELRIDYERDCEKEQCFDGNRWLSREVFYYWNPEKKVFDEAKGNVI